MELALVMASNSWLPDANREKTGSWGLGLQQ
jgi:hypothetical protein